MKLTKENIVFIDNYLQNSGVFYYDVRVEMLDHVATAVEKKMEEESLDFYEAFKEYMMLNKKELLKNDKFWSRFSKETILNFLKFLIHPLQLIVGLGIYLVLKKISVFSFFSEDFTFRHFFYCAVIVFAVIQLLYFHLILRKRYYGLERLSGVFALIYYLQIFLMPLADDKNPSLFVVLFFSYLFVGYVLFFVKEVLKFKKKNKVLFQ